MGRFGVVSGAVFGKDCKVCKDFYFLSMAYGSALTDNIYPFFK